MTPNETMADLIASMPWHVRFRWWLSRQASRFGWWVCPEPMNSHMRVMFGERWNDVKATIEKLEPTP